MDWGTRRKPVGAIIAWGSLAIFAVLTILGIAGLVMGLQAHPATTPAGATQTAALVAAPEPEPVEERLPEEVPFAEAQAKAKAAEVVATAPEASTATASVAPAPAAAAPAVDVAATPDDVIASTFDQLVKPVVVPAAEVPEGAVATVDANNPAAAPAETAVADAKVELPMAQAQGHLSPVPPRNAAARAIDSEVPDAGKPDTALGYAAQPEDEGVHVGDSSINVRSGPSQDTKRLFALAAGAEVDVSGKSNGWVSITDSKGREGWVDASLLENLDLKSIKDAKNVPAVEKAADKEPAKAADSRTVGGSGVTVRGGPGKSNKQVFTLAAGSEVTVLDDSKGWLKIKDAKGRTGWAYKDYLK